MHKTMDSELGLTVLHLQHFQTNRWTGNVLNVYHRCMGQGAYTDQKLVLGPKFSTRTQN